MPVGFETDARNPNDVSSHIRQWTSADLGLRVSQVAQNLSCGVNEFFNYESISRTINKSSDSLISNYNSFQKERYAR